MVNRTLNYFFNLNGASLQGLVTHCPNVTEILKWNCNPYWSSGAPFTII